MKNSDNTRDLKEDPGKRLIASSQARVAGLLQILATAREVEQLARTGLVIS